jgi:hypothetical protein
MRSIDSIPNPEDRRDCIALNYKPKSSIAKNGKIQPKGEQCH